jgi:methyltransferase (TIGR00027 family)
MQHDQRSRTIHLPAIMRALHQSIDDDPKILIDPVAPGLIEVDDDRGWLAPLLDHPFAKGWRAGFALRARYAEDCLAEGVQRGVSQYVILGAGLDTFPYRQPSWGRSLRIYEVDHPITQQWKRDRLKVTDITVYTHNPVLSEIACFRQQLGIPLYLLRMLVGTWDRGRTDTPRL